MSREEVSAYRTELNLSSTGFDVPAPVKRFEHCGLSRELMIALRKQGFESPTCVATACIACIACTACIVRRRLSPSHFSRVVRSRLLARAGRSNARRCQSR